MDAPEPMHIATNSIGLTVLCIAEKSGYQSTAHVLEQVRRTLPLRHPPQSSWFFSHFNDIETG
jgi:hypothetical protein